MNMQSKVGIDFSKVEQARGAARAIAEDVQTFVDAVSYTHLPYGPCGCTSSGGATTRVD